MSKMFERVARAVMVESVCGCSTQKIGGQVERVFCDDDGLEPDIRQSKCDCKNIAKAAIEALIDPDDDTLRAGAIALGSSQWTDDAGVCFADMILHILRTAPASCDENPKGEDRAAG